MRILLGQFCRSALVLTVLFVLGDGASGGERPGVGASPQIAPGARGFQSDVRPFLTTYCVKCHGPAKSNGNIAVHTLKGDLPAGQEPEKWESILEMLESGEMPPVDEPQPDQTKIDAVVRWIESGMRAYAAKADTGRKAPLVRRLTNVEYQNTLRDLIGFKLDVIDDLPKDPIKPYEFNNTGELMRIGPEQIDRYLEVARRAMASAIVDAGEPEVHKTRREWPRYSLQRGMAWVEIGVYGLCRDTVALGMGLKSFPSTGEFRIRIKASAILPPGYQQVPLRLIMGNGIQINSSTREVREAGVVNLSNSPDNPKVIEFSGRIENFPPLPGRTVNGRRLPDRMTITPQNIFDDGSLNDRYSYGNLRNIDLPRVVIESMEFESPVTDVWPPAHHTAILFDSPLRKNAPDKYVREVLKRFMARAYRRPASQDEVEVFARIYNLVKPELKTIEAAMRETLSMVLISPQFLYHIAPDTNPDANPGTAPDAAARTLVDPHYAMASRLSYFLWASMPDRTLLDLAANQKLADPAVIEQQVLRMLADERSGDFVENFTMQWLSLHKMRTVPVNRDLFPRFLYYVPAGERAGTEMPYLPTVRDYMIDETVSFVGELIRRNASPLNVVDSSFVMLNQRLAAHYGVKGVSGVHLRPVQIEPGQHLGGLLTQGSVLIGNGTGTAPHPVYRAVWLREAILGDEVAEPPAEVPALSDSAGESAEKALTIAGLLAKHRTVESCKNCHFRLDPWGIPFEHYNAIGQYQPKAPETGTRVRVFEKEKHTNMAGYQAYLASINKVEVPASARLPHGPEVRGMRELKAYLLKNRKGDIVKNVVRRLLSYATGRKLNFRDRFAVEKIVAETRAKDSGMRDIIVAICKSRTFSKPASQPVAD